MMLALAVFVLAHLWFVHPGWADHGIGVPASRYVARNDDEAAIVRLIRTVGEGWERKDADRIMSAYAPDATQRAWDNPDVMLDYDGIRSEALGAFRDPAIGQVRFEDWIHRIYIVNHTAVVEINQRFHGWGRDHYYRDLWTFVRRQGQWRLFRFDYEPQPPFPGR
ncbi:MAG: DUF4440 domain-containing protein [Candidatus Rokubacteria bacterium]|nr:DUF4440 domain-containing protein [Candidatus Rokubacteria bacterium]